eukprot:COSAG02_NODE_1456_length_12512_cov_17.368082_4_plen_95_part_00
MDRTGWGHEGGGGGAAAAAAAAAGAGVDLHIDLVAAAAAAAAAGPAELLGARGGEAQAADGSLTARSHITSRWRGVRSLSVDGAVCRVTFRTSG